MRWPGLKTDGESFERTCWGHSLGWKLAQKELLPSESAQTRNRMNA
jgi:hypothetical protein